MNLGISILNFFFPIHCGICGREDIFSLRTGLCGSCYRASKNPKRPFRCSVCDSPLLDQSSICEFCDSRNVFFTKVWSLRDRNDLLGNALNKLKSGNEYTLSIFLSLGARRVLQKMKVLDLDACILLPSYSGSMIFTSGSRPFSPSERLEKEARRILKTPFIQPLRKISPERQAGKSFSERFFHAHHSWEIQPEWKGLCPAKILLLDDVFTTGASVNEASRILKNNGAKSVYILTYLRTAD